MRRYLAVSIVAVGCAAVLDVGAGAQTTESKTTVKTEGAKTVHYTGCVQNGTETRTFVLQNVVPVATTTRTTGTAGTVTTTTYALVPEGKVELQEQLGHKVEVTGVLIPAGKGNAKIETRTKTKDTEEHTKTEVERGPLPQLRVISVKHLADSCS
jgi:hypothetical protein